MPEGAPDRPPDTLDERLYRLIGERVHRARVAVQMPQQEIAERAGLIRTSITNIERGSQRTPVVQLVRIARALGLSDYRDLLPSPAELERGHLAEGEGLGHSRDVPGGAAADTRSTRVLPPARLARDWAISARRAAATPATAPHGAGGGRPHGART